MMDSLKFCYSQKKKSVSIINNLIEAINTCLSNYQERIKRLKNEGHEIIVYARKPLSNDDLNISARLLQSMMNTITNRLLTTRSCTLYSSCTSNFLNANRFLV